MRTSPAFIALLLLGLWGCSHPPPIRVEPPLTGHQRRLLREEGILSQTREAIFEYAHPELLHLQTFYDEHGIPIHWVADSTFTCVGRSPASCLREDPMDFYICPITSERLNGEPYMAATYDATNDILWLAEAEVSFMVRRVMVGVELQLAWERHVSGRNLDLETDPALSQSSLLFAYHLLNRETGCAWSDVVNESALHQMHLLREEGLPATEVLQYGSPDDGWRINAALEEPLDVESLDRNYLLFTLMLHATMGRLVLVEAEQNANALSSIELRPPID